MRLCFYFTKGTNINNNKYDCMTLIFTANDLSCCVAPSHRCYAPYFPNITPICPFDVNNTEGCSSELFFERILASSGIPINIDNKNYSQFLFSDFPTFKNRFWRFNPLDPFYPFRLICAMPSVRNRNCFKDQKIISATL